MVPEKFLQKSIKIHIFLKAQGEPSAFGEKDTKHSMITDPALFALWFSLHQFIRWVSVKDRYTLQSRSLTFLNLVFILAVICSFPKSCSHGCLNPAPENSKPLGLWQWRKGQDILGTWTNLKSVDVCRIWTFPFNREFFKTFCPSEKKRVEEKHREHICTVTSYPRCLLWKGHAFLGSCYER